MITLQRTSARSIELAFDMVGARLLLEGAQGALNHKTRILDARIEPGVFSGKKVICPKFSFALGGGALVFEEDTVLLQLDEEDLSYGIKMFSEAVSVGYFTPAEFVRILVTGREKEDDLICQMIPN